MAIRKPDLVSKDFANAAHFKKTKKHTFKPITVFLMCNPSAQGNTRDSCTAMRRCVSAVDLFKGISKSLGIDQ